MTFPNARRLAVKGAEASTPLVSALRRRPEYWTAAAQHRTLARRAALLAASVCCASSAVVCQAQVLEIDGSGAVTVYKGPAVTTSSGVVAIAPTRTAGARSSHRETEASAPTRQFIGAAAEATALSPALVEAVAWAESRMNHTAQSPAGAIGEMQLMPKTARALQVDPSNARQNYLGGAQYLRLMLNRYGGDITRALAAYNAGPGAVDRYGGVPPYKETQTYVASIMDRLGRSTSLEVGGAAK